MMDAKERVENLKKFFNHEWLDADIVTELFGISFNTALYLFDFSQTRDWWALVGETPEERSQEGKKVTCRFRLERNETPLVSKFNIGDAGFVLDANHHRVPVTVCGISFTKEGNYYTVVDQRGGHKNTYPVKFEQLLD